MDAHRFDALIQSLAQASSRRLVLSGLAAALPAFTAVRMPRGAGAKKRKKPLQFNEFGCIPVGATCRGRSDLCCSGICQGKKPKKGKRDKRRCVGHDEDTCLPGQNLSGCGGQTVPCTTPIGQGACRTTTGNAAYCSGDGQCRQCSKDADCQPFCGPQAACVVCVSPLCAFGTICAGPIDDGCIFPL